MGDRLFDRPTRWVKRSSIINVNMGDRLFNRYRLVKMRSDLLEHLDYVEINIIIDKLYSAGYLLDERKKMLYCAAETEKVRLRELLELLEKRVDLADTKGNTKLYDAFLNSLEACLRPDLVEMFKNCQRQDLIELLENCGRKDLVEILQNSKRQDLVEILQNCKRHDLVEVLQNFERQDLVEQLKNCKLQDLVKMLKGCERPDLVEMLTNLERQCVADIFKNLEPQNLVQMLTHFEKAGDDRYLHLEGQMGGTDDVVEQFDNRKIKTQRGRDPKWSHGVEKQCAFLEIDIWRPDIRSIIEAAKHVPFTDKMLFKIIGHIGYGWKVVAPSLGIEPVMIEQICHEFINPNEQKFQLFSRWKRQRGFCDGGTAALLEAFASNPDAAVDWEGIEEIILPDRINKNKQKTKQKTGL